MSSTILSEIKDSASTAGLTPKEHSFAFEPIEGTENLGEPGNFGVRIPRGSTLMAATRAMGMGNPMAPGLREKALSDFLGAYELQKDNLDKMGTHPRGELLFGIADTYARQGNAAKADEFFALLAETSKDTPYAERAAAWKASRQPLPPAQANCIGCHVK